MNIFVWFLYGFIFLILGQKLYGRVLWSPEQDLKSAYKLTIEKVFLCTGRGYFQSII